MLKYATVKSVKYIYKYVYKGHDRASVEMRSSGREGQTENGVAVQVEGEDEIKQFLDARYVSASEACWRIFHYSLHKKYPSHQRLQIHLEGQQNVCFDETTNKLLYQVVEDAQAKDTTLTAWFKYNRSNMTQVDSIFIVSFLSTLFGRRMFGILDETQMVVP